MDLTHTSFTFANMRLVAAVKDGGAIVETGPLLYEEGRSAVPAREGGPCHPPRLSLFGRFGRPGASIPDTSVAVEARIVIDGNAEFGSIEIRGDGWVGYDEKGHLEGSFDDLPVILIDPMPPTEGVAGMKMSADEWLDHIENVRPRPTAEYDRASRGRLFPEDDEV